MGTGTWSCGPAPTTIRHPPLSSPGSRSVLLNPVLSLRATCACQRPSALPSQTPLCGAYRAMQTTLQDRVDTLSSGQLPRVTWNTGVAKAETPLPGEVQDYVPTVHWLQHFLNQHVCSLCYVCFCLKTVLDTYTDSSALNPWPAALKRRRNSARLAQGFPP